MFEVDVRSLGETNAWAASRQQFHSMRGRDGTFWTNQAPRVSSLYMTYQHKERSCSLEGGVYVVPRGQAKAALLPVLPGGSRASPLNHGANRTRQQTTDDGKAKHDSHGAQTSRTDRNDPQEPEKAEQKIRH